jgi:hypothetical protein
MFDPVFDHLCTMTNLAKMAVYATNHLRAAMPEFSRYSVFGHGCAMVERLQSCSGVAVAERMQMDFGFLETTALRYFCKRLSQVPNHFFARYASGREQQRTCQGAVATENVVA